MVVAALILQAGVCNAQRRGAVAPNFGPRETRAERASGALSAHSVRSTADSDVAEAREPLREGLKDDVP